MINELIIAYTAMLISIINIVSSSLWITYSQQIKDTPLLIRGSSDLLLFSISTAYIMSNRIEMNKIQSIKSITNAVC
jgi:hypothetical protein